MMDMFSVSGQLERDLATREGEMYLRAIAVTKHLRVF
jgi:hypothetical protein